MNSLIRMTNRRKSTGGKGGSYMVSKLFNLNKATLALLWANVAFFFILCSLASCEKADFDADDDSGSVENASLIVKTRTSTTDEEICFPVNVYVMDSVGNCVEISQLNSSSDKLEIPLKAGSYDVYAVGGASEDAYELPSKESAAKDSKILLRDGMEHGDLMSSHDAVVLTKGESNTLTLAMKRKVAMIDNISIEGIPGNATAVDVTLSPLYKYLLLDGNNGEETTTQTINLVKATSTGVWKNSSSNYILESSSNISIKVGITVDGEKSSFTCNYKGKVDANHKMTLIGKYIDDNITLKGVLTGDKWDTPVTINFDINGDGSDSTSSDGESTDDNSNQDEPQTGSAPAIGSLYDNCVVVKSTVNGSSTTVTLMTLDEYNKLSYSSSQKGKDNAKFQAEIASCIQDVLDFFEDDKLRLPTIEELENVYDNRETINAYIESLGSNYSLIELKGGAYYCGYYYLADDDYIYVYTLDGQINKEPNPNRTTYKVRGFKTLTFTN